MTAISCVITRRNENIVMSHLFLALLTTEAGTSNSVNVKACFRLSESLGNYLDYLSWEALNVLYFILSFFAAS